MISRETVSTDAELADMVAACYVHAGLPAHDLAVRFGQPDDAVGEWGEGKNLPTADVRADIVEWSRAGLAAKIAEFQNALKDGAVPLDWRPDPTNPTRLH
jgi:hypothetical protein